MKRGTFIAATAAAAVLPTPKPPEQAPECVERVLAEGPSSLAALGLGQETGMVELRFENAAAYKAFWESTFTVQDKSGDLVVEFKPRRL